MIECKMTALPLWTRGSDLGLAYYIRLAESAS